LFFNPIINKILYGIVWIYKVLRSDNKVISHYVDLYVDQKPINLASHHLKGLIFINIRSYAGGSELWDPSTRHSFAAPSSQDGLLEVVGIYGLKHLAQIKAGLCKALPLAQGKDIQVVTKTRVAMQSSWQKSKSASLSWLCKQV
jgi:diacylglycerol kinase (ATP)